MKLLKLIKVHLSECKKCKIENRGTQKLFDKRYIQDDHKGRNDWKFMIIDQCTSNVKLRKREFYWQNHRKTFFPNGLNERKESYL